MWRENRYVFHFAAPSSSSALRDWRARGEDQSAADLVGERKWMWKLNHILNCTTEQRSLLGSHADERGREERGRREGGGGEPGNKLKKKDREGEAGVCLSVYVCVRVCLPAAAALVHATCSSSASSPLPNMKNWQLRRWFLFPSYAASIKRRTKTLHGTINNLQWAPQCCHALARARRPRGRQRATNRPPTSGTRLATLCNSPSGLFVFFPSLPPTLVCNSLPSSPPHPHPPRLLLQSEA